MIKRREFLRTGLLAAGAAGHPASFAFSRAVDSASADSRIDLLLTPVGHVFAMYAAHQDGQAIRAVF
jgi:hypothetical protein